MNRVCDPRIYLLTAIFAGLTSLSPCAANDVQAIRVEAQKQPSLVSSLIYKSIVDVGAGGRFETESWVDGHKYRHNFSPSDANSAIMPRETAFDGERYQALDQIKDGVGVTLGISRKGLMLSTSSGSPDPILLPYAFLFKPNETATWGKIRDPSTWDQKFDKWEYAGVGSWNSRATEQIRLPGSLRDSMSTVSFAPDLGWYPVRCEIESKDGTKLASVELVTWREELVDGRPAIVPIELSVVQNAPSGEPKLSGVCLVNEDALQINIPVPQDLFTINPERALDVVDIDKRLNQDKAVVATAEPGGMDFRLVILLVSAVLLSALYIYFSRAEKT